jgi:hypothetical protein
MAGLRAGKSYREIGDTLGISKQASTNLRNRLCENFANVSPNRALLEWIRMGSCGFKIPPSPVMRMLKRPTL